MYNFKELCELCRHIFLIGNRQYTIIKFVIANAQGEDIMVENSSCLGEQPEDKDYLHY